MEKINAHTAGVFKYALAHMEAERDRLSETIDMVRRQLGMVQDAAPVTTGAGEPAKVIPIAPKRFSEAARKRMAQAQSRRWAKYKAAKNAAQPRRKTA